MITAVDTNVLIDILEPDPAYGPTSRDALKRCLSEGAVVACEVVWAEVATSYSGNVQRVVRALRDAGFAYSPMDEESALEAAKSWHAYRKKGGNRERIAADFLIGGHARVQCDRLLTRDHGFYRVYFKPLRVETPL